MNLTYQDDYKNFIDRINGNEPIDAKTIGELIVRLAHYFSDALGEQAKTEHAYQKVLAGFEKNTDDAGKALSSAKAESFARATDEYKNFLESKAHVTGIDAMINALKAFQKGTLNEFSHLGNT